MIIAGLAEELETRGQQFYVITMLFFLLYTVLYSQRVLPLRSMPFSSVQTMAVRSSASTPILKSMMPTSELE